VGLIEVFLVWDSCPSVVVELAYRALAEPGERASHLTATLQLDEFMHQRAAEGLLAMPTIMPHIKA
jgi:hypothetical protein